MLFILRILGSVILPHRWCLLISQSGKYLNTVSKYVFLLLRKKVEAIKTIDFIGLVQVNEFKILKIPLITKTFQH